MLEQLPVSYSEVLLLLQGVDKRDEEVLIIEESGEQSDALLYVGPCCVGGLMTEGGDDTVTSLRDFALTGLPAAPSLIYFTTLCVE